MHSTYKERLTHKKAKMIIIINKGRGDVRGES
jgi:hypothetical protein